MNFFSLIPQWASVVVIVSAAFSAGMIQADPTDDFSFSLSRERALNSYDLIPVNRVEDFLADHVDLLPRSQIRKLAKHLITESNKHRFDPAFILAVIQVESQFRIKARSPVGAVGLMQVMPDTARIVLGSSQLERLDKTRTPVRQALQDPFLNVSAGVAYLSQLRDRYEEENPYFLLAAYNMGPSKLEDLRQNANFRPSQTLKYFHKIRKNVQRVRFYSQAPRRSSGV